MSRFKPEAFKPLDDEEKELMDSIERDEWSPISNLIEEREKAIQAAKDTLYLNHSKTHPNRPAAHNQASESVTITLEPDVADVFGTAEAVNLALRAVIQGVMPALPDAV